MKIYVVPDSVVDCTADPHPVEFDGFQEAVEAVVKVMKDRSLIRQIASIRWERHWWYQGQNEKSTEEVLAEKEPQLYKKFVDEGVLEEYDPDGRWCKVVEKFEWDGKLYSFEAIDGKEHYAPCDVGVMLVEWELSKLMAWLKKAENGSQKHRATITELSIGVVWSAFGEHNCSDYVHVIDREGGSAGVSSMKEKVTSDFSNQDWYVGGANYEEHCERLSDVLGMPGAIEVTENP